MYFIAYWRCICCCQRWALSTNERWCCIAYTVRLWILCYSCWCSWSNCYNRQHYLIAAKPFWQKCTMMTFSNGNIFRVTGPLHGEFTGHRWWFSRTKASDAELWCFLWSEPWINGWVNNRESGDLRHHCAHYDVIVTKHWKLMESWSIYRSISLRSCQSLWALSDVTLCLLTHTFVLKNVKHLKQSLSNCCFEPLHIFINIRGLFLIS